MAEIENLVISVSSTAAAAASGFDRLASSMGKLGGASRSAAGGMKPVVSETKKVASTTEAGAASTKTWADRLKGLASALSATGSASGKSASKLSTFVASLKRIAYYRFIRTVLKEITQGLKEGLTNLYTWSSAVNGNFAASMNTLSTAALYLKNSLAAMVSPLIESLAPAIDFIIDKFVGLLNVVNQFIAALGGASTYTAAKKVATTWSGAAKTAAGAARGAADDIKRTILGFDEINKLSKDSSGGGGGGGGGSKGGAGSTMFEERPINNTIKGIADTIRSVFGPIFDWISENIDLVTVAVAGVGAALLAWKIGSGLIGALTTAETILGRISAAIAGLAVAAITLQISYDFDKRFLKTGDFSNLIVDGLSTALGGIAVYKVAGAAAGWLGLDGSVARYAAGIYLAISAFATLAATIQDIKAEGVNEKNLTTGLWAAIKAAAAGIVLTHSWLGGIIGFNLMAGVVLGISFVSVVKSEGFTWKAAALGAGASIGFGTAAAAIGYMLGLSENASLLLGGAVFAFNAGVVLSVAYANVVKSQGFTWKAAALGGGASVAFGTAAAAISSLIGLSKTTSALFGIGTFALSVGVLLTVASVDAYYRGEKGKSLALWAGASVGYAAAGAAIAFALGLNPVAGAIIFTIAGIGVLIGIDSVRAEEKSNMLVHWGDKELTYDEIKKAVAARFSYDIDSMITISKTVIENASVARSNLNQQLVVFSSSVNKIKLHAVIDDSEGELTRMKEDLENNIIPGFNEMIKTSGDAVELGITLVPPVDGNGQPLDAEALLGTFTVGQATLREGINEIGRLLGEELSKGFENGLTTSEAEMIANYYEALNRINNAFQTGETVSAFKVEIEGLWSGTDLTDLTGSSFANFIYKYSVESQKLYDQLLADAKNNKVQMEANLAGLKQYVIEMERLGLEVPQSTYDTISQMEADIASFSPELSAQRAYDEVIAPFRDEVLAALGAAYGDAIDAAFDPETVNVNQAARRLTEGFDPVTFAKKEIEDPLTEALKTALGEGYEKIFGNIKYFDQESGQVVEINASDILSITGWDLLGAEGQRAYMEAFMNSDAMKIFLESSPDLYWANIGLKISEMIGSGMDLKNILPVVLKESFNENGELTQVGDDMVSLFNALGANVADGLISGIDGGLTDSARQLAEIFGFVYDEATDTYEVHSPSKLFERLGDNLVAGLMNGLHTLGTKLQGVWDALPEGAKTAINTVLGLVSGAEVDIGNTIDAIVYNTKDELNTLPTWLDKTVINQMAGAFTGVKFYNAGKGATNEVRAGLLADPLPDLDVDVKVNKPDTAGIAAMFGALNPVITPTLKGPSKSPKTYDDVFGNKNPVVNPSLGEPTGKTKTFGELFGGLLQKVKAQLDKDNPDKDKTYGSLFGGLKQKVAAALGKDEPDKNKTFGTLFGGLLQTVKGKLEKDDPDKDKTFGSLFGGLTQKVKGKLEKADPDKEKTFGTLFGGLEQTVNAGLQPKEGAPKQIIDLFGGSEQLTPEVNAKLERAEGSPIGFAGEGNTLFGTLVKHVLANVEKNKNYSKNSLFGDNSLFGSLVKHVLTNVEKNPGYSNNNLFGDNSLFGPLNRSVWAALKTDKENSDSGLKKLLETTSGNPFKLYATLVNKDGKEEFTVNGKLKLSGKVGGNIELTKALGGILSNGRWSSIPQYAGGSLNAGSLFWAGEAGPELVGHANGRTEVLNRSQLASTMFAAVRAAMGTARINASYYDGGRDGAREEDMAMLMELVRQGSEATQRQNELLRQQNDYLRQINDKDFTAEISTSAIANGMNRQNRRAGTTVVPVGT